jgi:hypothetical protein
MRSRILLHTANTTNAASPTYIPGFMISREVAIVCVAADESPAIAGAVGACVAADDSPAIAGVVGACVAADDSPAIEGAVSPAIGNAAEPGAPPATVAPSGPAAEPTQGKAARTGAHGGGAQAGAGGGGAPAGAALLGEVAPLSGALVRHLSRCLPPPAIADSPGVCCQGTIIPRDTGVCGAGCPSGVGGPGDGWASGGVCGDGWASGGVAAAGGPTGGPAGGPSGAGSASGVVAAGGPGSVVAAGGPGGVVAAGAIPVGSAIADADARLTKRTCMGNCEKFPQSDCSGRVQGSSLHTWYRITPSPAPVAQPVVPCA